MYFKEVGYFCKKIPGKVDELHRPVISFEETKVFCNVKSVGMSEFYQAQVAGFKPELKIEVKQYNGCDHFKLNDKLYKIIRTFNKGGDVTELTLTSSLNDDE